MKYFEVFAASLFLYTSFVFAHQSSEADVLHAIDTICADTWCEGGEFIFDRVDCFHRTKSCTVFFTINGEQRHCDFAGVSTYDAMLDSPGELRSEIYARMTNCIHTGDS